MSKAAVEFRRGMLAVALEGAQSMLAKASRSSDLLPPDDRTRVNHAAELLAGVVQRLWSTKQ